MRGSDDSKLKQIHLVFSWWYVHRSRSNVQCMNVLPNEGRSCGRGFSEPHLVLARRGTLIEPWNKNSSLGFILDCRSNLHLHLHHICFTINPSLIPTFVTSNLRHLAVADKCVMLDVKIPHLHEILFARVHVREVVDHLWRLDSEPSLANYHNQTMSGKRKMMLTGSVWY